MENKVVTFLVCSACKSFKQNKTRFFFKRIGDERNEIGNSLHAELDTKKHSK